MTLFWAYGRELIDGVSLRTWLVGQRRTRAEVLHMLLEAGRGLSAAHRAGVVHRDFKLSNVMVSAQGRVQVVDFGLARTLGSAVGTEPRLPEDDAAAAKAWHPSVSSSSSSSLASGELTRTGTIVEPLGTSPPSSSRAPRATNVQTSSATPRRRSRRSRVTAPTRRSRCRPIARRSRMASARRGPRRFRAPSAR